MAWVMAITSPTRLAARLTTGSKDVYLRELIMNIKSGRRSKAGRPEAATGDSHRTGSALVLATPFGTNAAGALPFSARIPITGIVVDTGRITLAVERAMRPGFVVPGRRAQTLVLRVLLKQEINRRSKGRAYHVGNLSRLLAPRLATH